MSDRRTFLIDSSALLGALPLTGSLESFLKLSEDKQQSSNADQSVINFWTSEVRKPSENFAHGITAMGGPAYQPAFVHYKSAGQFEASSQIDSSDIPEKAK